VRELRTRVTSGGAPVYVWPGGGITLMVDVLRMPDNSFGYVPTPALVAPIEFTMTRVEFVALGGYEDHIRPLDDVLMAGGLHGVQSLAWAGKNPWPLVERRALEDV
jgi:hypothetical protein